MGNKLYYTIKEVSEMLEIEQSTLRFWEKNFPQIVPQRSMGNHRMYTLNEIEQVKVTHHTLVPIVAGSHLQCGSDGKSRHAVRVSVSVGGHTLYR